MANYKITETEKAAHHLQALADRPNAMTSYKQGKLSADGMKKLFDDNLDFLADKHNALAEAHDFLAEKHDELAAEHDALEAKHEELAAEHDALEASHQKTAAQVETLISEPIDRMYPIGAVYISFDKQDPAEIFGGTWEELEEGRFLMSGALSGNTGGAEKHSHDVSGWAWISGEGDGWGSGNLVWKEKMFENGEIKLMDRVMGATLPGYAETATYYGTYVDGYTNNVSSIPPYITVHMWRRIA